MATYFEARKAEAILRQFKDLAQQYWDLGVTPETDIDSLLLRLGHFQLSPEWGKFRETIHLRYAEVRHYAYLLGVTDGNLYAVTEAVDQNKVLDSINKCLGVAQHEKKRLLWRQALNPLYYLIIAVGYLLRIPFLILQQAGVPSSIEEGLWGHAVKVLMLTLLLAVCTYFGVKLTVGDALRLFH